jgi:hypothetical protein
MICDHCFQGVLRRLAAIRVGLEREFSRTMTGYEQLLRGAMNEAEALAWQTPYPHLFFPGLAEEKAVAARQWVTRQRSLKKVTGAELLSQPEMVR